MKTTEDVANSRKYTLLVNMEMLASVDGLSLYREISRKGRIYLEERGYST